MKENQQEYNQNSKVLKKNKPKENILEIVKQFITYFEETDRSQKR